MAGSSGSKPHTDLNAISTPIVHSAAEISAGASHSGEQGPLLRLTCDLQIIGHRENIGDFAGADAGEVFVVLIVHYAFKVHVAVLDDDVDRLVDRQRVSLQWRVTIDGMEEPKPQAVVK